MTDFKRRASNALPFQKGAAPRGKIELNRLREKIQKAVIDNPATAKKAALLITSWIEGKARSKPKKAA